MNFKLFMQRLAIIGLCFSPVSAHANEEDASIRTAQVAFKTGTIIEVAYGAMEGGKEAQLNQEYFPKILPIAAKYGGKMSGSFSVTAIIRGEMQPQMIAIFEWPSLEARNQLLADKEAQKLFPLRDDALTFFKQAFYTTKRDFTVTFREDKTYEFFNAWLTSDAKELLPKYFEATAMVKTKYGPPKFVATLDPYENSPAEDYILHPHMFGIVEWNDTKTYYGLAADPDYKKHLPILNKALSRMDMLHAKFNFPQ